MKLEQPYENMAVSIDPSFNAINAYSLESIPQTITMQDNLNCYLWVSDELGFQISQDSITPADLIKLCDPKSFRDGESTDSTTSQAFLQAIPDVKAFTQVWLVFISFRTADTTDSKLVMALTAFLHHIIDLDRIYYWSNIVDYILSVCEKRFGRNRSSLVRLRQRDINSFLDHLIFPACVKNKSTNQ